nr:MAG TPA: nucelotide kinase [Caudoviricetes sp.]
MFFRHPPAQYPLHSHVEQSAEPAMPSPASVRQVGGTHYEDMAVQPWDAMESWMSPEAFQGHLRACAIKYLARCDAKGGLEDLKKAKHYLDKLIEVRERANA